MSDLNTLMLEDQKLWQSKWAAHTTGWDSGGHPHRALLNTLAASGSPVSGVPEIPREGKALVPGCGTGYDVLVFAERGLETLGVDSSAGGIEKAREFLKSKNAPENARVELADFFTLPRPSGGYDLIYDYTFLCALPPPLRPSWASQLHHLSSPTTTLITLQFPLSTHPSGPPYALSHALYDELLGGAWERVWGRTVVRGESRAREGEVGLNGWEEGREGIAVWRRRDRGE